MSSRREEKDKRRAEREALERESAKRDARRQLLQRAGGGGVALAAVVAVVIALTSGGGGGAASVSGSGASAGLQTTPAPWAPEFGGLLTRIQALNLPSEGVAFHVHEMLRVYVEGKQIPLPAQIGIDPQGQFLAPLHTHDSSGVIHVESNDVYPYTLGQFFEVWGVRFTKTQLGSYTAGAGNVLQVYVNGKPVADPPNYKFVPHDAIVVGYGKPGSFPTHFTPQFAAGL